MTFQVGDDAKLRFDGVAGFGGFGVRSIKLEEHELVVGLRERLPAETGIARFGEVGPGGQHLLGEIPVALGPGTPAVLEALEDIPQVGGVERALELVLGMRAVVRQRTGEFVGPGLGLS